MNSKKITKVTKKTLKSTKKRTKKTTYLSLLASIVFATLAFVAWKKKHNRISIVFGLFAAINAGYFMFEIDALEPIIKVLPLFTVLFTALSSVALAIINIVAPGFAKNVTETIKLK